MKNINQKLRRLEIKMNKAYERGDMETHHRCVIEIQRLEALQEAQWG